MSRAKRSPVQLLWHVILQLVIHLSPTSAVDVSFISSHDISLDGSCRSEILYTCSHVLTEEQRMVGMKSRVEGAAVAGAVAPAVVEPMASRRNQSHSSLSAQQPQPALATSTAKASNAAQVTAHTASASKGRGVPSNHSYTSNSSSIEKHQPSQQKPQPLHQELVQKVGDRVAALIAARASTASLAQQAPTKLAPDSGSQSHHHSAASAGHDNGSHGSNMTDEAVADTDHTDRDWLTEGGFDEDVAGNEAADAAAAKPVHAATSGSPSASNPAGQAPAPSAAKAPEAATLPKQGTALAVTLMQPNTTAVAKPSMTGSPNTAAAASSPLVAKMTSKGNAAPAATSVSSNVSAGSLSAADGARAPAANSISMAPRPAARAPQSNGTQDAATKLAGGRTAGSAGGNTAVAAGQDTVRQQEQQQQQQRRLLAVQQTGGQGMSSNVPRRGPLPKKGISPEDALPQVLASMQLNPNLTLMHILSATAPFARCLRHAVHESQMSLLPDVPGISNECEQEVHTFFVHQASSAAHDPPLLGACAQDIVTTCNHTDPTKVFSCLKQHKAQLRPNCRSTVIVRQVERAGDILLDPELSTACSQDRQRLCEDAERGNGAAQACLEQYLSSQGSAPEPEGQGKPGKAGTYSGLSPPCAAALFKRQVEESEDIRFNFRLSAACAGDKSRFCPELRPGQDDVVGCLEHHAGSPEFSEECQSAIERNALLRATDVRLDARFRAVCHGDVHALCFEEEAQILSGPLQAPPGEGTRVMDCMRRSRERIRSPPCRQHVTLLMAAAYRDSRLDGSLLAHCEADVEQHCIDPSGALQCLKAAMAKHKVLEPECMEAVRERSRQAAADIRFLPTLSAACGSELRSLCTSPDLSGPAVLDCLADNRNRLEFSVGCRTVLVDFLADAVSDVRMLHSLKQDCSHDITTLCSGLDAGKGGGVLACLQQKRADISGEACKRQILRLLGLAVEDYRLGETSKACKADVQQYCGGVKADSGSFAGAVHACLRKSWEHLSPGCRRAEQALELAEHEDVRLNPRIQRECPLAIKQFCDSVPAGNANVLSCLQSASSKPSFPQDCKSAIDKLLERAHAKYSLNIKLKAACDPDVAQMCPGASDEPQRVSDPGILGCLAANSSALSAPCRVELAALVHVHLDRYRIGMPLTSPCDGDVMARCNVDKQVTPFLMGGYVQACLSRHAAALHKPCWALISMFDERQYQAATVLEAKHWTADLQKEALDKMTAQISADVRRELEPNLVHKLQTKVHAALEQHSGAIKPMMSALMNALLAIMAGLVAMAWYVWRRLRNTSVVKPRTIAIKDGRV